MRSCPRSTARPPPPWRKRYERARKKLALALSESELDEQKEVVP